jgi:hypothetical protein
MGTLKSTRISTRFPANGTSVMILRANLLIVNVNGVAGISVVHATTLRYRRW